MLLFELATRKGFRYDTNMGKIDTERLWQLPIEELASVYDSYDEIRNKKASKGLLLQSTETSPETVEIEQKMEIIKHIFDTKMAEKKQKEQEMVRKSELDEIERLIQERQKENTANLSLDELEARRQEILNGEG